MRFNRTSMLMLAVCSLLLSAGNATAQQSSQDGVVQLGHRSLAHRFRSADHCDSCGVGDGHGSCRHRRAAGINGGHYGYGCNPHYSHCGIGHCLNAHSPYHVCTHAPDHGWAPPLHRPMYPTPALYGKMFPGKWTGEQAGLDPGFRHPMVYMPTDTTQLGYYYQQTPYWRSRPNMIPPVPHPAEWHTPDLGVVFTGFEDAAACSLEGCPADNIVEHGSPIDLPPVEGAIESSPMQNMPMEANPVPLFQSVPGEPYAPAPTSPQLLPPAEEMAPAPPGVLPPVPAETTPPAAPVAPEAPDLSKSASLPLLIPVPPQ